MEQNLPQTVISQDGLHGRIVQLLPAADSQPARAFVEFENGRQALVKFDLLSAQSDGSYRLDLDSSRLDTAYDGDVVVLPVIQEELHVGKRRVTTGAVRVTKIVREHEELVDEPLLRESVEVNRIPVNQMLDAGAKTPGPRQEGTTLVIPLLEEVLVVEKRLLIKEELHIRMLRTEEHEQQRVTLRSEDVRIDRTGAEQVREIGGTDPA